MLDKVQRRGVRIVKNDYRPDSSVTEMLTGLQWVPLEERRRDARLYMLDKIAGGRVAINIEDYAQRVNTRIRTIHKGQIEAHWCKNSMLQNSFFSQTIVEWNTPNNTPSTVIEEIVESFCP